MRPHILRLRAFGPFPDEVVVDLDALAGSGLFLLHGETGAGKTTLLDGIGFALYGRVPGLRGKTGRLRSDHADPAVRTEVELEVTLGGRRWRITRSPAQERAKSRGTGTTTEQARVHLQELRRGAWTSVSTRIDEAAAELDPLLGMSADQFFQVVLLPQGEFAQFLRADSAKRGELLQRLFATERFKAVEDWLVARRISTSSEVAAARQELEVLSARLAQAAAVEVPSPLPAGWAPSLLSAATAEAAEARAASTAAESERDSCRALAGEVLRVQELQRRRASALATSQALDRARAEHDALRVELRAANRAAELVTVLDEAAERQLAASSAGTAEAVARARLVPVGLPVDSDVPTLVAAADGARRRAGRLEALRGVADALADEQGLEAAALQEVAAGSAALERVREQLAVLPGQRASARAAVVAAQEAVERLPVVEAAAAVVATARAEAAGLAACTASLEQLREEHVLARETLVSLREKEHDLREARFISIFAELADRLEDGIPCEVCGATSHPDPYIGDGDSVTRDDEDRARIAAEHAAAQLAGIEARVAAETATAEGHRRRLVATGHEPADLEPLWARLQDELAALRTAAATLTGRTATVERLDAAQVSAQAAGARLEGEVTAAGRRATEAQQRASAHSARLRVELDGSADLAGALAGCEALASACDEVRSAAAAVAAASGEAVRSAASSASACAAAGFPDTVAARAAVRPDPWREQAERRCRAFDDERAAVAAVLAEPDLADLRAEPADVAGAAAAVQAADLRLQEAFGRHAAAQARLRQVTALVPELVAAQEALVPLEQRAGHVRRMADLCTGGGANALKMTLTSFVLAARLEEVAAVASARLLRMTQGRYSLVHTDGAARGGARSGLGLLARDSWTGQDRDTSTLSGGETFLASLALALGLADVVQAEAGGTRIEALFVDEGFGTLDEETLDEVMDVLDGLREGGRVVGLVSHVAELRGRIPAQVHVRKTRRGSSVALLGC